jgi:hypothetical protein
LAYADNSGVDRVIRKDGGRYILSEDVSYGKESETTKPMSLHPSSLL